MAWCDPPTALNDPGYPGPRLESSSTRSSPDNGDCREEVMGSLPGSKTGKCSQFLDVDSETRFETAARGCSSLLKPDRRRFSERAASETRSRRRCERANDLDSGVRM